VSLALPGSILDNAQSPELRTYLAGQIARALAVFNVDEVVIFDESGKAKSESNSGLNRKSDPNILLARILQYLECPQYLRKNFFPKHSDLQYAGLLNPLDTPHHMKVDDDMPYREGVVLDRPVKKGSGSFVNVGMRKEVRIDKSIKPGVRVTVKMEDTSGTKFYTGMVVSPSAPRTKEGLYWGYSVRLASSFGAIFTQSPYKEGYDITIGTSERGTSVDDLELSNFRYSTKNVTNDFQIKLCTLIIQYYNYYLSGTVIIDTLMVCRSITKSKLQCCYSILNSLYTHFLYHR